MQSTRQIPFWMWLLGLAFIMGLLFRLSLLCQPLEFLYGADILVDDAYYTYSYAQEFVRGHPFQIGPGQMGNGFQPLQMILIAPFFIAAPPGAEWPIRLSLLFSIGCSLSTAGLLVCWARRLGAGRMAVAAGIFWALSPMVTIESLNGLETSLSMLLLTILGTAWPWLKTRPLRLGLTLALVILARVDNLLLLPVIGALLLHAQLQSSQGNFPWRALLRKNTILAIGLAIGLAPYGLFSWYYTHTPFPQSGLAVHRLTQYCFGQEAAPFFIFSLINANLQAASQILGQQLRFYLLPGLWPGPHEWKLFGWWILYGGALAGILAGRQPFRRPVAFQPFSLGVIIFLIWILAYTYYVGGSWFYRRYFHGTLLLVSLGVALILRDAPKKSWRIRLCALAFVLSYGTLSAHHLQQRVSHPWMQHHAWLPFVRQAVAHGERIGMGQSGLFNYHTAGEVINLDGVANNQMIDVLQQRAVARYLHERAITILIGWPQDVDKIILGRAGNNAAFSLAEIPTMPEWTNDDHSPVYRLSAYRVVWHDTTTEISSTPQIKENHGAGK